MGPGGKHQKSKNKWGKESNNKRCRLEWPGWPILRDPAPINTWLVMRWNLLLQPEIIRVIFSLISFHRLLLSWYPFSPFPFFQFLFVELNMCGILAVLGCSDDSQAKRVRVLELSRRQNICSLTLYIYFSPWLSYNMFYTLMVLI